MPPDEIEKLLQSQEPIAPPSRPVMPYVQGGKPNMTPQAMENFMKQLQMRGLNMMPPRPMLDQPIDRVPELPINDPRMREDNPVDADGNPIGGRQRVIDPMEIMRRNIKKLDADPAEELVNSVLFGKGQRV
jgi:hypothetical protein